MELPWDKLPGIIVDHQFDKTDEGPSLRSPQRGQPIALGNSEEEFNMRCNTGRNAKSSYKHPPRLSMAINRRPCAEVAGIVISHSPVLTRDSPSLFLFLILAQWLFILRVTVLFSLRQAA